MSLNEKIDDKRPFKGLLPQTRRRLIMRVMFLVLLVLLVYTIYQSMTSVYY